MNLLKKSSDKRKRIMPVSIIFLNYGGNNVCFYSK